MGTPGIGLVGLITDGVAGFNALNMWTVIGVGMAIIALWRVANFAINLAFRSARG